MRAGLGPAPVVTIVLITPGYFGDLANCDYASHAGRLGGHTGIGPPSGAGTLGTEAYTYVPSKPTSSSNALSERFIVILLGGDTESGGRETAGFREGNYTQARKFMNS
jgi:hypothetical protein